MRDTDLSDLPTVCPPGRHIGPLIHRLRFREHPDPFWWGHGNCAVCRSTITEADLAVRPTPTPAGR